MKKIKVLEILNALPILRDLSQTKMNLATSYKIRKLIDECNIVTGEFEKRRNEMFKDMAGKEEKIPDDKQGEWDEKIKAMAEEEVEIPVPSIKLEEIDNFHLEPANFGLVEWFVEVPE